MYRKKVNTREELKLYRSKTGKSSSRSFLKWSRLKKKSYYNVFSPEVKKPKKLRPNTENQNLFCFVFLKKKKLKTVLFFVQYSTLLCCSYNCPITLREIN